MSKGKEGEGTVEGRGMEGKFGFSTPLQLSTRRQILATSLTITFSFQVIMTGSTGISPAARNATLTSLIVCAALVVCLSPNKLTLLANSLGWLPARLVWLVLPLYEQRHSQGPIIQLPVMTICKNASEVQFQVHKLIIFLLWCRFYQLTNQSTDQSIKSNWFYHFTVVLVFINNFINPFVYATKYREFQQGVRCMMSKVKGQHQSQVSTTT